MNSKAVSEEKIRFGQLLKRELMNWYFSALYSGKVKSESKKKTSLPLTQKKCKNL